MVALQNRRTIDYKMYGCNTKQKEYWWKDVWLFHKTEGQLMGRYMVAYQDRRTIDGKMYGWWKDVWLLYKTEGLLIDGCIFDVP